MSLEHAFSRYLKRFGTAEKNMKTMSLNHAFLWYLEHQRNRWKQCIYKACILMVFETIWKKILKALKLNGAFCRYFIR